MLLKDGRQFCFTARHFCQALYLSWFQVPHSMHSKPAYLSPLPREKNAHRRKHLFPLSKYGRSLGCRTAADGAHCSPQGRPSRLQTAADIQRCFLVSTARWAEPAWKHVFFISLLLCQEISSCREDLSDSIRVTAVSPKPRHMSAWHTACKQLISYATYKSNDDEPTFSIIYSES